VLDAQAEVVSGTDDPAVRAGGDAHQRGLRLQEDIARLAPMALFSAIAPGTTDTAELSRLHATVEQQLGALVTSAAGSPYEQAAVTAVDDLGSTDIVEAAAAAREGEVDIDTLLSAMDIRADDTGLPAYLDRVEGILSGS
jgi:hypothetical protein